MNFIGLMSFCELLSVTFDLKPKNEKICCCGVGFLKLRLVKAKQTFLRLLILFLGNSETFSLIYRRIYTRF